LDCPLGSVFSLCGGAGSHEPANRNCATTPCRGFDTKVSCSPTQQSESDLFLSHPTLPISWELGTRAQALLELSAPSYSVITPSVRLPPPSSLDSSLNATLADVFTIARNAVAALPPPPSNGTGQPLVLGDASAGDPASIGVAVLIANWTNLGGEYYGAAATAQVQYLLGPAVPKTQDGAISHVVSQLQLWYASN
jgi:hypothetical protein